VDILEERFGVVGEPYPRAEEAQADYARFTLATSVFKLDKSSAHYSLQPVVGFLGVQQNSVVPLMSGDYLPYLSVESILHPLPPLTSHFTRSPYKVLTDNDSTGLGDFPTHALIVASGTGPRGQGLAPCPVGVVAAR
jgi:hypothetical protein